jgi:hypothetical protein
MPQNTMNTHQSSDTFDGYVAAALLEVGVDIEFTIALKLSPTEEAIWTRQSPLHALPHKGDGCAYRIAGKGEDS